MLDAHRPHVLVLANGDDSQVAPLTRALYGIEVPKQLAVIAGARSLLQAAVERALGLTTPERILVILSAPHEGVAREQLAAHPGLELVVQPRNLDRGPALALGLLRVLARSSSARVVVLPADHYVADAAPLHDALRHVARGAIAQRIALIGVPPSGPELEYGWLVPGRRIARSEACEVRHFLDRPTAEEATRLREASGLWNTSIEAGPVAALWWLLSRRLPFHAAALERYAVAIGTPTEAVALRDAYRLMPRAGFSHDVRAHADALAVMAVAGTGWSDWGSPARVFASLAGTADHAALVDRIRGEAVVTN